LGLDNFNGISARTLPPLGGEITTMLTATKRPAFAPITHRFADDGRILNNPALPMILYRGGVDLAGSPDPELLIEKTFADNGWGDMWRNGIYPYVHYHSKIHEVLGIARGRAKVRFGGEHGVVIDVAPGDIVVLPAGTGHQCLSHSRDLVVIGAYPPSGEYNLCRGTKAERAKALALIAKVPLPATDPVYGPDGPLPNLWRA
jgi:uncharacterized protein YjlB